MRKKRHASEPIIAKRREAELALSQGVQAPAVCRKLGISEQAYCRWRKEVRGAEGRAGQTPEGGRAGEHPTLEGGDRAAAARGLAPAPA
jgi:transposase-like protein